MKILLILLLTILVTTSPFAVIDPGVDLMGIYFDHNADAKCIHGPASVPFNCYLILTNTTAPSINAYELGLRLEVPAGNEAMIFRLASTIANGVVDGIDVGTNGVLGGDFIVGLGLPLPAQEAMILHSFQYMLTVQMPVYFYIGASSIPSIPGDYPVVQNAEGSILMQVGLWTGNPDYPVAAVNDYSICPLDTEEASFGRVKSLYR